MIEFTAAELLVAQEIDHNRGLLYLLDGKTENEVTEILAAQKSLLCKLGTDSLVKAWVKLRKLGVVSGR